MLNLKSLTFQNIGRFVERQTIHFNDLGNLIQVEGQNKNTGGSSGAAKSTIFKALNWNMGLDGPSTTILQSRLTKNPMEVISVWDWDGKEVQIERGKKLTIILPDETISGSSKLSEEKLDEIIGMPRELFSKILHKKQGEQGFFLNMGPSEVHKFLTSCLGLDKEQAKLAVLDTRLGDLVQAESSVKSAISSSESGLEATSKAIESLGAYPVLDVSNEALELLKKAHEEAALLLNTTKESHKKQVEQLEITRPQVYIAPFDRSRIVRLENEIATIISQISDIETKEAQRLSEVKEKVSELQIAISNLNNQEKTRVYEVKSRIFTNRSDHQKALSEVAAGAKAKDEAIKIAEELKKVRASICPTCEQNWTTDSLKAKETSILQKLEEYKAVIISGASASARVSQLDADHASLQSEATIKALPAVDGINKQLADLEVDLLNHAAGDLIEPKLQLDFKQKMLVIFRQEEADHQFKEKAKSQSTIDLFAQKQAELKKNHDNVMNHYVETERAALTSYESARHQTNLFVQAKSRYEESLVKLMNQSSKYQTDLDAKKADYVLVAEEIELATESKKAIKSYLSASFEDALDSIGDMATRLVRSIPNMGTATIQFDGLKTLIHQFN